MDTKQLAAALDKLYDLGSNILFFPIRHHSPACTFHLQQAIQSYQPDAILIEGPYDTNHLLADMGDVSTEAPLAIYYSHTDEITKHRKSCYYPMVDFSPELYAIRYGIQNNVYTTFIDLPYSAQVGNQALEGRESYYEDYFVAQSTYIQQLCDKQGCRNYSELWEKIFEINSLQITTKDFVKNIFAMCYLSRAGYPSELLEECIQREQFMTIQIQKALQSYSKVLVITGGFHTCALIDGLSNTNEIEIADFSKSESYLIPYTFGEIDQLSGYKSGMPHPAFYQQVYTTLSKTGNNPYEGAVMHFIIKTGMQLRKQKNNISLSEEIAAYTQAQGLAQLRDKHQAGIYELLDDILSTYVKQEIHESHAEALQVCISLLKEGSIGKVPLGIEVIPIIQDFKNLKSQYKLTLEKTEIKLSILSKPRDRKISIFLHRLDFLSVEFAKMTAGPNYRELDTARLQEKWVYKQTSTVFSRLVDISYLGGTIEEAVTNLLDRQQLESNNGCGYYTQLLIDCLIMDIPTQLQNLINSIQTSIISDNSIESLGLAIANLLFLDKSKLILNNDNDNKYQEELLRLIYIKFCSIIPFINTNNEQEDKMIGLQLLNVFHVSKLPYIETSILSEMLKDLYQQDTTPPFVYGSSVGILYSMQLLSIEDVINSLESYLFASGDKVKLIGRFLGGLFSSAWDIVFHHQAFIEGLTTLFENLDENIFMNILPDLRLAFSSFSPKNISKIADNIASLLHVSIEEVLEEGVNETTYQLASSIDKYVARQLKKITL